MVKEHGEPERLDSKKLVTEIKEYLQVGGLFNPEMIDHQKVRDLLIRCLDYVEPTVYQHDCMPRLTSEPEYAVLETLERLANWFSKPENYKADNIQVSSDLLRIRRKLLYQIETRNWYPANMGQTTRTF